MTTQAEFAERCAAAAAELALFFVGVSHPEMMQSLVTMQANLQAGLAQTFGADVGTQIAAAFVATVVRRRREIGEPAQVVN